MLSGSAVKGGLAGEHPGRQRQPGRRPRRQDRLPHRLPVADRRMAGRRPDRHPARRPVPGRGALRRRHHAPEGRVASSPWLGGRPFSPSWCSPSQQHREWRDRPASASTGCTCRRRRRCRRCRSRSRWTSSSGACAARTCRSRRAGCRSTSTTAAWTTTTSPSSTRRAAAHGPAGLGRRCGARRRRLGGPGEAVLLALRRHAGLARGEGHGVRRHSEVDSDRPLDVDLQRRQRLELLAAPCQQRLVRPARVDLREHAERLQQQRAPGTELLAGAALELGPGQAQARRGELVREARCVPREPVGVELEVESIHACEARRRACAVSVTRCAGSVPDAPRAPAPPGTGRAGRTRGSEGSARCRRPGRARSAGATTRPRRSAARSS